MKKRKKRLPSEDEVAQFWDVHDATQELDLSGKKRVQLIYEPAVQSISLRLPLPLLTQIKQISAHLDIAYQALIKIWLAERARQEKMKN